jgi:hypothetical protein
VEVGRVVVIPKHQDHEPVVDQRTLYLKFTVDDEGKFLLTRFKEA